MDRNNGGDRAAILTMVAMMLVFLLSSTAAARLQNPLRAGMLCLVLIYLGYVLLESKSVVQPPPPLDPSPPQLPGRNDNDGYHAPPNSLAGAYSPSGSGSPVDGPPLASPPEEYSYFVWSESSRSASTTVRASSSSTGIRSSRSRHDLSGSDLISSDEVDSRMDGYRRWSPSSRSKSSGSAQQAAKRPSSRNAYSVKLKRMFCLAPSWRTASARRRSRSLTTINSSRPRRQARHISDSDFSSGSRSSSCRTSRSASGGQPSKSRSRSRRGRKTSAYTKLKRMLFKGKR